MSIIYIKKTLIEHLYCAKKFSIDAYYTQIYSWFTFPISFYFFFYFFFRTTTTYAVFSITVFLNLKFHSGSTLKEMGPQWKSICLHICIMILIGWDLHYVLLSNFTSIRLPFLGIWTQDYLIASCVIWRPILDISALCLTIPSMKATY